MGTKVNIDMSKLNQPPVHKKTVGELYNIKVAMWQIPFDKRYKDYDKDGSYWFEMENENGVNEIETVESELGKDFSKYKVASRTRFYSDNTSEIETLYPSGNNVNETFGINHVFVRIKDRLNRLVAEKIFNKDSHDGRKTIYQYAKNGDNEFTVVKIFSYDTSKNRKTDTVNYGYTSDFSTLTKGCNFEKEYYMLNGEEVQADKINESEYIVKTQDGKILTFTVE